MSALFNNIKNKIQYLTLKKYFLEIYCFLIALITFIGFVSNTYIGFIISIIISIILLVFLEDITYIIPNIAMIIFNISEGFSGGSIPYTLIIVSLIFVLVLIWFNIKLTISSKGNFKAFYNYHKKELEGKKLSSIRSFIYALYDDITNYMNTRGKSFLGLLLLGITNILPIFLYLFKDKLIYVNYQTGQITDLSILYIMFFANIAYFIAYLVINRGIKKNAIKMLAITFSYVAILLSFECLKGNLSQMKETGSHSILEQHYYLGWGLCNEAGIMIIFSIPFIFYLLLLKQDLKNILFQSLKIFISAIGIILTTSRGGYLFFLLEILLMLIVVGIRINNKKMYFRFIITIAVISLVGIALILLKDSFRNILLSKVNKVFDGGLSDNGRVYIWETGTRCFNESIITRIIGPGMMASISQNLENKDGAVVGMRVFHSTLLETLAVGGILGLFALMIHMYEKYTNLYYQDKSLMLLLLSSNVVLALYGLIDNTYHMYYFMIPLSIVLATLDASTCYNKKYINSKINLFYVKD